MITSLDSKNVTFDEVTIYSSEIITSRSTLSPQLSIIIPAYNEEKRIGATLHNWTTYLDRHFPNNYEILVVMDGCEDGTFNQVYEYMFNKCPIIPLIFRKRLGKGLAITEAMEYSRGKILFFTDADGSFFPLEFTKFLETMEGNSMIIGSRFFANSNYAVNLSTERYLLSRIYNALVRILFKDLAGLYDTQCGAKAIRRESYLSIKDELIATHFTFDVNMILSAIKNGQKVSSIPIEYQYVEEDSKISGHLLKISFYMLLSTIRLRIYYSRFREILNFLPLQTLEKMLLKFRE
jgi:dolichyl-phosphate beta-glucosyltransferase